MFEDQIKALELQEIKIGDDIIGIEEQLKKKKAEVAVVRRAIKSLKSAQESLENGQADISE